MKMWLCCMCMMLLCSGSYSQTYIKPRYISVSNNQTTNLVFPGNIISTDRGCENIIVQKSTANVLKVKAVSVFADTTNLTVITSDGTLYSFLVAYSASPVVLNIDLGSKTSVLLDTAIVTACSTVLNEPAQIFGLKFSNGNVMLRILSIYSSEKNIYVKMKIDNHSSIVYDPGEFTLSINENRRLRQRAYQDNSIMPVMVSDQSRIAVSSSHLIVVVLPTFSLTHHQHLHLDVTEKNANRALTINIPAKYILQSKQIKLF